MKKFAKTTLFRMTAIAAVILSLLASCTETPEKEKTLQGTVTANTDGEITFMYSRTKNSSPASCSFTTDLPAPDDQFVLTIPSGETTVKKDIDGLTAGKKVKWTAKVEGKPMEHGSGNFVHIVNN